MIRGTVYALRQRVKRDAFSTFGSIDAGSQMSQIAQDPFGFIATLQEPLSMRLDADDTESPAWLDVVSHKTLIHFTVLARYYQDFSSLDTFKPLLEYTRDEVLRYCHNTVSNFNPALSEKLVTTLDTLFLPGTFLFDEKVGNKAIMSEVVAAIVAGAKRRQG
jgi:hypothetical protein